LEQLQTRPGDARGMTVPPSLRYEILQSATKPAAAPRKPSKEFQETVCASCALTRESTHGELDQWISCNGCQLWFHFDCAGFKNERDVRDVSKFFCKVCEPKHGSTTFVRKSSRAHAAVDYAGLNQGILKTSDDNPEHHYIQPIKDGSFTFDPEMFPRMRPELVTREFFETCSSFSEPVVILASVLFHLATMEKIRQHLSLVRRKRGPSCTTSSMRLCPTMDKIDSTWLCLGI
jgi:F-box/leucine-rich repeat protein 10/11